MSQTNKPSKRYIKHGYLERGEKYNQNIHSYGNTPNTRNLNYDGTKYYSESDMKEMMNEIKTAECPICFNLITNTTSCKVCENGHKFHSTCHQEQETEVSRCPTCRSYITSPCSNTDDVFTGGKKKRKTKKKIRKIKSFKKRREKNKRKTRKRK